MLTRIPGLLFEAVSDAPAIGGDMPDAADAPAGESGDFDPSGAGETDAPAQDAAPDFSQMFSTPEGQEALRRAMAENQPPPMYDDPYAGYGQPEPEPDDPFANFDFLADDAPQQLSQILEMNNQRLLAAIQGSPALAHAEEQHHTAWASDQFGAIERDLGTTLPENLREMSITMAAGQRPPDGHPALGHFDPGRALRESAQSLHALIQQQRQDAVRAYQEGAAGGGSTGGGEPPAGGQGAIHSEPQPSNMREAREAWERREGLR